MTNNEHGKAMQPTNNRVTMAMTNVESLVRLHLAHCLLTVQVLAVAGMLGREATAAMRGGPTCYTACALQLATADTLDQDDCCLVTPLEWQSASSVLTS